MPTPARERVGNPGRATARSAAIVPSVRVGVDVRSEASGDDHRNRRQRARKENAARSAARVAEAAGTPDRGHLVAGNPAGVPRPCRPQPMWC